MAEIHGKNLSLISQTIVNLCVHKQKKKTYKFILENISKQYHLARPTFKFKRNFSLIYVFY